MSGSLRLDLFSPSKTVYGDAVSGVVIPGIVGELGVLPGHASIVAEVGVGKLVISGARPGVFFIAGGFAEVSEGRLTILADVVEKPEDIDMERAKKARERALARLQGRTPDVDLTRARKALRRADFRLALVSSIVGMRFSGNH